MATSKWRILFLTWHTLRGASLNGITLIFPEKQFCSYWQKKKLEETNKEQSTHHLASVMCFRNFHWCIGSSRITEKKLLRNGKKLIL